MGNVSIQEVTTSGIGEEDGVGAKAESISTKWIETGWKQQCFVLRMGEWVYYLLDSGITARIKYDEFLEQAEGEEKDEPRREEQPRKRIYRKRNTGKRGVDRGRIARVSKRKFPKTVRVKREE